MPGSAVLNGKHLLLSNATSKKQHCVLHGPQRIVQWAGSLHGLPNVFFLMLSCG